MSAQSRILSIVEVAEPMRTAVLQHLQSSFESWQRHDGPNCSAQYEAADWFAIQHMDSNAFESRWWPQNYQI